MYSTLSSLNEVRKFFGQFFELLFSIIGFASMSTWKKSPLLMDVVFLLSLYYLALVLVTMLQLQNKRFLPFIMVILFLGSVVSFLALIIISPIIAWIDLSMWILIFALLCYKNRKELDEMVVPKRIKNFIEDQSVNGMSIHSSKIPGIELIKLNINFSLGIKMIYKICSRLKLIQIQILGCNKCEKDVLCLYSRIYVVFILDHLMMN
jgi:hypothetical protein